MANEQRRASESESLVQLVPNGCQHIFSSGEWHVDYVHNDLSYTGRVW